MRSTLVLDPAQEFLRLRDGLALAGWHLVSSANAPLLPGEPEYAVFERGAGGRAFYTFNPVCRLRVLDLPEGADPGTLTRVRPVNREQIESWMASDDERTVLRGVLAARQLPDVRLLERVVDLRRHPRATVAEAAARVSNELRATVQGDAADGAARRQALAAIEVLKAQVAPLLQALARRGGEVLSAVKPREEDYAKTFMADAVEAARSAYATIWNEAFSMRYPDATQTVITCELAPAGMLTYDNELSRPFPGGYRSIARLLQPHRVWVCWKCLRPGASAGMAYDGLTWLDDHWAWFPKPYRVLAAFGTSS